MDVRMWSDRHRVTARRIIAAVAVTSGLMVIPQAAHADPTPPCYGNTCTGKSAQATGCDSVGNSYWVDSVPVNGGQQAMYLWYSSWCGANWAELVSPNVNLGANDYVENANNQYEYGGAKDYADTYTTMVDGSVLAKACVIDNKNFPPSKPGCTAWH